MAGYHIFEIPKGTLGQYSKVIEEFVEFSDSVEQDCAIMAIMELSDVIGSLKSYFYTNGNEALWNTTIANLLATKYHTLPVDYADLKEVFELTLSLDGVNHWERLVAFITEIEQYVQQYNLTIRDLIRMSHITERAFLSGQRQ